MLRHFRINNLHSKQLLDYCRNSTQESIRRLTENLKNKEIKQELKMDYENPNHNHNIIIGIMLFLSMSSYLYYSKKMIKC